MELNGIVALVTGAGSGMGAETARWLAKNGAKVAVLDVNESAATKVAAEIKGFGIACDVSDSRSVEVAFATLKAEWGVPRVCVNCAGIIAASRVVNKQGAMKLEDFRRVIDINLVGTFNVLRLAAEEMTHLPHVNDSGERGVIINTASIAAYEGQIGQAAYSASKGGIIAMTLPVARELATFGIRVVAIAPGIMETPMIANLSDTIKASLQSNTVFPKRLGKPQEFAKMVLHIIDNALLNGEIIRLDGAVRLAAH